MKKRKAPLSGRGLVAARRSRIHGSGVFALRNIRKRQEIVHYLGKLRTHEDVDETYAVADDDGHTFYFTLNDKYVVDAARGGNVARWINHSCRPNCEAVTEEDPSGDPRKDRILIQAIRNIAAGDELSYDYGISIDGPVTAKEAALWACRCGAPNCAGTLLEPRKGGRATGR
jgi:uncharacterized protein